VLELQRGLPIGREALWPSEPCHSPDKATLSYHTKNEIFVSGICKIWCVCVSTFTGRAGIYRAMLELHRLGQGGNSPSGGWPANELGLHRLSPPS
jgi:hypothetical protein